MSRARGGRGKATDKRDARVRSGGYYAQPARDWRPALLGALGGATLVILAIAAYLLGVSSGQNSGVGSLGTGTSGNVAPRVSTPAATDGQTLLQAETDVPDDAPRISMADFKELYDDPAGRPLIIDVRPNDEYQDGHIKGAMSFPGADVDKRAKELPKDEFIVAYCD